MNKPKTVKESELISVQDKELFEYFLLRWGLYYSKTEVSPRWSSVIREILGESEEDFYKKVEKFDGIESVSEYLNTLKKTGRPPVTINDIILHFEGTLSKNSIISQLNTLKKWKEVKEFKVKVQGYEKTFYSSI